MPRLQRSQCSLGDELGLVRAYLELMQMRMPDRLQFSMDVEPALLARPFPAMALLTLVENAVEHGVQPPRQRTAARRRHDFERGVVELEDHRG